MARAGTASWTAAHRTPVDEATQRSQTRPRSGATAGQRGPGTPAAQPRQRGLDGRHLGAARRVIHRQRARQPPAPAQAATGAPGTRAPRSTRRADPRERRPGRPAHRRAASIRRRRLHSSPPPSRRPPLPRSRRAVDPTDHTAPRSQPADNRPPQPRRPPRAPRSRPTLRSVVSDDSDAATVERPRAVLGADLARVDRRAGAGARFSTAAVKLSPFGVKPTVTIVVLLLALVAMVSSASPGRRSHPAGSCSRSSATAAPRNAGRSRRARQARAGARHAPLPAPDDPDGSRSTGVDDPWDEDADAGSRVGSRSARDWVARRACCRSRWSSPTG